MKKELRWFDAIIKVFEDEKKALHYTEIAELISEKGYRKSITTTPTATVSAYINDDIKNNKEKSKFVRINRGEYTLRKFLNSETSESDDDFDIKKKSKNIPSEKSLYIPLKEYLNGLGLYNLVEIPADNRKKKKWGNVDLISIKFTNLDYHLGVFPKTTAIEVKNNFPVIEDIQQAASYLRYCHSSYLCFLDLKYTGSNIDDLMTRLRNERIWNLTDTFRIGLIVAFYKQKRSKNYGFQIIKEAPEYQLDPNFVEEGIDLLSKDGKKTISIALNNQILKLISKTKE